MSKNPKRIGITGGIGAGKSLVCRIFSVLGAPVYDADARAKALMTEDSTLKNAIQAYFGQEAYTPEGTLNREYLAQRVFGNENARQTLNDLVHPAVGRDFSTWVLLHPHAPYLIKEAALMFESGAHLGLDKVVMVTAPQSVRVQRVLARDTHRTAQQIEAIINSQMPEEEKLQLADEIIVNDETQLVIPQVLQLDTSFRLED
jgi:dephospho-CoA kinase